MYFETWRKGSRSQGGDLANSKPGRIESSRVSRDTSNRQKEGYRARSKGSLSVNGEGNRRLRPISIEWPAAMLEITRPSAVPGGRWSGLSLVLKRVSWEDGRGGKVSKNISINLSISLPLLNVQSCQVGRLRIYSWNIFTPSSSKLFFNLYR